MTLDYYPPEEGYIDDGLVVGFSRCIGTVNLHDGVYHTGHQGTVDTGYSTWVVASAATGVSVGIALKAGTAGDLIPVCLYGIVKLACTASIAEQDCVQGSTGTWIMPLDTLDATGANIFRGVNYTGLKVRLGTALQGGVTSSEILVLVGRIP